MAQKVSCERRFYDTYISCVVVNVVGFVVQEGFRGRGFGLAVAVAVALSLRARGARQRRGGRLGRGRLTRRRLVIIVVNIIVSYVKYLRNFCRQKATRSFT